MGESFWLAIKSVTQKEEGGFAPSSDSMKMKRSIICFSKNAIDFAFD